VLKQIAIVATFAVACLMLAVLLNGPTAVIVALFISAAAATTVLLFFGYSLIAHLTTDPWIRIKRNILAHIVLHIVPASYVALQFLTGATLLINTVYLLPLILFFYTGRRTWAEMFKQSGRKMYRIYYFGNTALMRVCPILLACGFLVDEPIGTEWLQRSIVIYSSIHFLITGWTMFNIEKDILRLNSIDIAK